MDAGGAIRDAASLFGEPLRVVNLGLEGFAEDLARAGVPVVHVDWRPPAGGDARLAALVDALDDDAELDTTAG